ncbi:hypothetical protein M569_11109, partial [Genlisea aurea]
MGKKSKKPGKGKEKTERKTAKADEKRTRRDSKKLSPEDDIDAILLSIQKEEAKKKQVHIENNVPAPSPRSNCSLTVNPLKETELILYGGEYYNGNKTFVYGDLYRYDVEKKEWKLISSPNSPPPRSAHQAVAWKSYLYIYGGEFTSPNQERFHHYKDFWMLDLKTNQWEQLNYKGCPSPRSGHRMVIYKHKIIIFGGFYDTLREVSYFNDMHVFDLDQFKWQEIKPTPGCLWPTPRSGFQFFVHQDAVYLYGGYSKEVSSSEKKVSERGIVHSDMWCLDPRTWEWNKVKKSGMPPGPRAGFSMCVHKRRALLFGGVVDMEMEGDLMMSLFLNELYGFQLDNYRWYPLELRKEKGTTKDKFVKPCGRINSCMVVGKDTLYVYGGLMEVKDEEVTLDDLYSVNLSKLDEWHCMIPASEPEWIDEPSENEDDSSDEESSSCEGSESSEEESGDEDEVSDAVAVIRGDRNNLSRKAKRLRIEQIRVSLGLSDSQRTPTPGESLREFYKRTNPYWQMAAHEHTQHTGKELRRDGFDLAEGRYRELKPVLDELGVLEAEQRAEEDSDAPLGKKKKKKKKN